MTPLLEVRGLKAQYGATRVLHDVNFDVHAGGITALLGANGAGKTTTLRAICSMVETFGVIRFDGKSIERTSTERIVRLGVAHVPDGRGTFAHLTVDENLKLGAYLRRDSKAVRLDLDQIFHYFPKLQTRLRQQAGTLSGGEQQMLAVSRALMSRPRLLLLDEPSFGLAPIVVNELFGIFREINLQRKVSILLVEQNASIALKLATHACLLETGCTVLNGRAEELAADPTVRRSYLGY